MTRRSSRYSEAMTTTTAASNAGHVHTYEDALEHLGAAFGKLTADTPLFTTDASGLWDLYLRYIDPDRRQHYNCRNCRHFIERFGGLAIVQDGRAVSPLWVDPQVECVDNLHESIQALDRAVSRAKITGVFLSDRSILGAPETGKWHHFHALLDPFGRHVNRSKTKTADQIMAEKREEYAMLSRSFGDFSLATVQTAHELLTSGRLYRSEKCQGVAKWLLDLHIKRGGDRGRHGNNITWLAVADAPAGFCHVRSGMIGTLLEDIEAGMDFDSIKRRFDEKMNPLQYMRPTAAPSAGNIAQAEKIVAQLESAGALARRFARLEEVEALWSPKLPAHAKPNANSPVFGHLLEQAKPSQGRSLPPVTMTWVKFRDTVLPTAAAVEFYVPSVRAPYCAIVTAANPEAPPILQWDHEHRRNPASWYLRVGLDGTAGSDPSGWNLRADSWVKVTAFTLRPCHWYGNAAPKFGAGVMALLNGARDIDHRAGHGGGFFPDCLRGEYHSVRATMEAYARAAVIEGKDEASACGILLQGGVPWTRMSFRVTTESGMVATYNLDRWD